MLQQILNFFFGDITLISIIVAIFFILFIFGVTFFIIISYERVIFSLLSISHLISILFFNIKYYLARIFCSKSLYIKYYNNHFKKRYQYGIILTDYKYFDKEFIFRSTNKMDLISVFLFIYGETKFGPLKVFKNKGKIEIDVIFYTKDMKEHIFSFEYDFEMEKNNVYKYRNSKLTEISILFNPNHKITKGKEGLDILANLRYAEYFLKIT